jgi:oligopeptidase B
MAAGKPFELVSAHGHKRSDPYYWLRERENPEVIAYLEAENAYYDSMTAHTRPLQDKLFAEMKGRIVEDDQSVPVRRGDYFYYVRYVKGGEYPIYARRKGNMNGPEEVLVDGNELGKGQAFLNFYLSVSDDHKQAAVVVDTVGRNFYEIRIKDLVTGAWLPDRIPNTRGGVEWTTDASALYYTLPDVVTLRTHKVMRHILGTSATSDALVYEEKDETLNCSVARSKSKKFLLITSDRTDASMVHYLDAGLSGLRSVPRRIAPLRDGVEYRVDHASGTDWMIYTNYDAVNFRLVCAPIERCTPDHWKDVVAHRGDVLLEDVDYFRNFMVLQEKKEGLSHIRIRAVAGGVAGAESGGASGGSLDGAEYELPFDEPVYSASLGYNPEWDTDVLRYSYTSLTTPSSVFDFDMKTRQRSLMKEQAVPGGFDKKQYRSERIMVPSRDGRRIPLSIVYRVDRFKKGGGQPGWLYAYGSYGNSMDARFSSNRLSLLDRGFVFAIAHVRGGMEMGGSWYEEGKMLNKKNTFYDFIDCSRWLQEQGYVAKDKLFAQGGSAGGLLMGAVSNMAPELYRGIIADVPFVDVISTMMDESIPLTTFEWQEWGNPNIKEQYDYMLSYSPYDRVERKEYPHMLVTTGLHDSQVQYWEPAKWVARLRAMKTDKNLLFLYTNMVAGHGGASGRFESLKEVAREYSFALDILDMRE